MAQPIQHQQYPIPPRASSPPVVASPASLNATWGIPAAHKRQRIEATTSQPGSPYLQSPYGMSPSTPGTPNNYGTPHFSNVQLPVHAYSTPYTNGHATTPIAMQPQSHAGFYPPPQMPAMAYPPLPHTPVYMTNATSATPGVMAPPSKPADKAKEDGESTDVLYNTGVDIRKEEELMASLYIPSFTNDSGNAAGGPPGSLKSFSQFAPGDSQSFYGAGSANSSAIQTDASTQEEYSQQLANQAWHSAAHNLAQSRQIETQEPFLTLDGVFKKMRTIAQDNGLTLKEQDGWKMPDSFPQRTVQVRASVGPESTMVTTSGSFLPHDTPLADQLALLSLATKHRLRAMVGEAERLARHRRSQSHGVVPPEWIPAAAPARESSVVEAGSDVRFGFESAVSPASNPLKRECLSC